MGWILRNWQLKIAALALATILYTGLVFSGSFTEGRIAGVSIQRINQPNGTYVTSQQLATLGVSYRVASAATAPVTADSFAATIDLSKYDMRLAGQAQSLLVTVRSLNDAVTALSWLPQSIPVVLDTLESKNDVRVVVDHGAVPPGLEVGTPTITPSVVAVTGPKAQINQVVQAEATVAIDTSGIDVNQPVDLRAVDASGATVESVELNPASVLVQITVRTVETSKTVPVRPAVTGNPAVGYEIRGIASDPPIVTLRGAPAALSAITEVTTQPFSVNGLAATKSFKAPIVIPKGLTLSPALTSVTVTVAVAPQAGSRTFLVGVTCTGAAPGSGCLPQLSQISVTLAGPIAALAGLSAAQLTPTLDVSGLAPGEHDVTPVLTLPRGITVLAFSPPQVPVVIEPAPTPTPGG
jgi:YbbR domain-containing protein